MKDKYTTLLVSIMIIILTALIFRIHFPSGTIELDQCYTRNRTSVGKVISVGDHGVLMNFDKQGTAYRLFSTMERGYKQVDCLARVAQSINPNLPPID